MMEFLAENYGTIIAGAAVLAVVAIIIVRMVLNKRSGKTSCSGDCAHCGGCVNSAPSKKSE